MLYLNHMFVVVVVGLYAQSQAAKDGVSGNPVFDVFLSYGPIGAILVAGALGYIWFKPSVESLREDKRVLQDALNRLLATYEVQVIPALHEAVSAMTSMAASIKELVLVITSLGGSVREMRDEMKSQTAAMDKLTDAVRQLEQDHRRGGTP